MCENSFWLHIYPNFYKAYNFSVQFLIDAYNKLPYYKRRRKNKLPYYKKTTMR